jgi:hypothetical protein
VVIHFIKLKTLIMKKFILILIASIGISFYLSAQSAGDYRSVGNGNWNDVTKWQRYNGSSWISTTTYPGQNPGTGKVTIMSETEIKVTETVPHPVTALIVSIDDPNIVPTGLTFSAENAVSVMVSGDVYIAGELKIDNQNGAKTHELFIGRNFSVSGGFQTINQDDKLGVTFNTTEPSCYITGGSVSFQDITFNGTGILYVYTNIGIAGTATFINGIVILMQKDAYDYDPNYYIFFGDGATVSGGSNLSYIAGAPCKFGDDPFTFPIGDKGIYAPLTISALPEKRTICAAYSRNVDGDPITDPELFSISNCEFWWLGYPFYEIDNNPYEGHYNAIDVTVGWTSATRCGSSSYIANPSDVVLAEWNGSWYTHRGTGTGTTTNGSVTLSSFFPEGRITLGNVGTDCRTPLGLITSNITSNSATVSWSAVAGAVSYVVDYSPYYDFWINAATATTSTSVNLSGLSPATSYRLRVRANCGSASSSYRLTHFTTLNPCATPSGLSTTNITSNSAKLNWGAVTNALNYDVEYKKFTDISWLTAVTGSTSLTYTLNGLIGSTEYNWRVKANCNVSAGNYAQSSFTTQPLVCNDVYETNNTSSQAKTISIGNTISAGISSAADVDWFKVTTPNNSNTKLEVTLSNLPADYDLYVYNKSLKLVGSSVNAGTANEVVIYNSNARKATYYIKVVGKNGAYNTSQCYNLLAQVSSGARSASGKSDPANEVTHISDKQLLYPNPASGFVYLNFNNATEGLVNIQIVNSIGQLVKQHPVNTIKGQNQVKILVADIRPGMYILRINKGDLTLTRKFIIAR